LALVLEDEDEDDGKQPNVVVLASSLDTGVIKMLNMITAD